MIIEQIYADNSLRNYNYIIACPDTNEAVVIDPLRIDLIMDLATEKNYRITKIINTHEHADHTDGNLELVEITGAQVYCHHKSIKTIPGATHGLYKSDTIVIGDSVVLKVLDTPGHTMSHVCLLANDISSSDNLAIFSGDTLFNAGTGHVYNGNLQDLYETFINILFKLPESTLVYPGHDYIVNNLNFTLSREPGNYVASELFARIKDQDPSNPFVTDLSIEKKINTFFRLDSQEIIDKLRLEISNFADTPSARDVFFALRELRNEW